MFKNMIKAGTNITFVENSDGTITINATGGGSGGGGLTEQEVRDIVNSMLNNYYTKSEINDIIAGIEAVEEVVEMTLIMLCLQLNLAKLEQVSILL
mgnify:CR=1 FL=1